MLLERKMVYAIKKKTCDHFVWMFSKLFKQHIMLNYFCTILKTFFSFVCGLRTTECKNI